MGYEPPFSTAVGDGARSPLAHPRWGIAWSNTDGISHTALIQNALLKCTFALTLEACVVYGYERVLEEWASLQESQPQDVSPRLAEWVDGQLVNIAKGIVLAEEDLRRAQAERHGPPYPGEAKC